MDRSRHRSPAAAALALSLALLLGGTPAAALAEAQVSVTATDPAGEAALGRDEPFYVRIQFTSDEPVAIWARPFLHGQPVAATKSNTSFPHSGAGFALGWFSLDGAGEVDEVRIKIGGGKPYREWTAATYPVKVDGTGLPAPARARAPWVDDMLRAENAASREAYERRMNEPSGFGTSLLMTAFGLATLALAVGGIVAPVRALRRWRGGWRIAAAVPLALMGFVVVRIIAGTSLDPTSHNLWPFEILMWGTISLLILGGIAIAHRIAGADR